MGDVNCLRCKYRHTDNGNCTAVGGFCTAVPAAHCPLLREYLDTELTPQEVLSMKFEWCAMMDALNSIGGGYTRLTGSKDEFSENTIRTQRLPFISFTCL